MDCFIKLSEVFDVIDIEISHLERLHQKAANLAKLANKDSGDDMTCHLILSKKEALQGLANKIKNDINKISTIVEEG